MEGDEGTQICPNCNREIPKVNFVTHSVHCVRNIKICPSCKEPVLQSELDEHNDKLHQLVPCEQCGEMVRGTDMEDHVRDSCDFTMQSCRYCTLELRRREVPPHERYCGARTERCAECGEYVMLRYRQVHLDSNHGFVRLREDSPPRPEMRAPADPTQIRPAAVSRPRFPPGTRGAVKKRPAPAAPPSSAASSASTSSAVPVGAAPAVPAAPAQPAAPSTPAAPAQPNPRRDLSYYSALQRRQDEDRRRREQSAYNLANGLPPVLDPAAKLEKLRKMDALLNRDDEPPDHRERLQGRVWRDNNNAPVGHTLGRGPTNTDTNARTASLPQGTDMERQRRQLADLQPMSPEEFMERFNELQLIKEPRDIRSSLRELRRGLNEVTAPYNNANNNNNNNNNNTNKNNNIIEKELNKILKNIVPEIDQLDEARAPSPEDVVMVPCEFCFEQLQAQHLLDHERVCREGLSRARGLTATPTPPTTPSPPSRPQSPWADDDIPVIPCEFCTEALPLYLINEHQELCGRDAQLLYPD